MELLATLYNADDEEVSSDVTYAFKIYKGDINYFNVPPHGQQGESDRKISK